MSLLILSFSLVLGAGKDPGLWRETDLGWNPNSANP